MQKEVIFAKEMFVLQGNKRNTFFANKFSFASNIFCEEYDLLPKPENAKIWENLENFGNFGKFWEME